MGPADMGPADIGAADMGPTPPPIRSRTNPSLRSDEYRLRPWSRQMRFSSVTVMRLRLACIEHQFASSSLSAMGASPITPLLSQYAISSSYVVMGPFTYRPRNIFLGAKKEARRTSSERTFRTLYWSSSPRRELRLAVQLYFEHDEDFCAFDGVSLSEL